MNGEEKSEHPEELSEISENDPFIAKVRGKRINDKYSLIEKLGQGGFGAVYLGRDGETGEEVALKLEHHSMDPSILQEEAYRYEAFQGVEGFPEVYWFDWHDDYKIMAFELLGPTLEDLLVFCEGRFSLKTALLVVDQLLTRLEVLHSKNVLHRDVKPDNFLLGCGAEGNTVYVTDLGVSDEYMEKYIDMEDEVPLRPRVIGTARFASIRGHEGRVQSPVDDLQSLGYMMIYLMNGSLPWQGLEVTDDGKKYTAVLQKKLSLSAKELCEGLPDEFATYMNYVRSLERKKRPDYDMLRGLFTGLAAKRSIEYDDVFDWTERLFDGHGRYLTF